MRRIRGPSGVAINPTHTLGERLLARLKAMDSPLVRNARGRGLLIGVEIDTRRISGQDVVPAARRSRVLTKDTHDSIIRFAPRSIGPEQIDEGAAVFATTVDEMAPRPEPAPRPDNLHRGSVPSSRHTANSPQGSKDGKA